MQIDRFVPRETDGSIQAASGVLSQIESITKSVDTTAQEQERARGCLTYAGEHVASLDDLFQKECEALGRVQTALDLAKKGIPDQVKAIGWVQEKKEIPTLLQKVQALFCTIRLLEIEKAELEEIYSCQPFKAAFKKYRKALDLGGVLGEGSDIPDTKEQKLRGYPEALFHDTMPEKARRVYHRLVSTTLHMLASVLATTPSGALIYEIPLSRRLLAASGTAHDAAQALSPLTAPLQSPVSLDGYESKRVVNKGEARYIAHGVKAWLSPTYYAQAIAVAKEISKLIAIAEGLEKSVKTSIGIQDVSNVSVYKGACFALHQKVSATIQRLCSSPCNKLMTYLTIFTHGLEQDIDRVVTDVTFLAQFQTPKFAAVAQAQKALEAYLTCDENKEPLKAVEALFIAANKIWEQESLLTQAATNFAEEQMVTTVKALHEILSRKGLEGVELKGDERHIWEALSQNKQDVVKVYVLKSVTRALHFTKKQDVKLDIVLHIWQQEMPGVAEYAKLVGSNAFRKSDLELAAKVVEQLAYRDHVSYAKALAAYEDLPVSEAPDALKRCMSDELKAFAKENGFIIVTDHIQKVDLKTENFDGIYTLEKRQQFFLRLLACAIWNRDFIQDMAHKAVGSVLTWEFFPKFFPLLRPEVRSLVYENTMTKIREGNVKGIIQCELDLLLKEKDSSITTYLQKEAHTLEEEAVGDVLFKLIVLESKKEQKPFTDICKQHMGERRAAEWFEMKMKYLRGWKIEV